MRKLIGTVVCFGLGMAAMWVAMHFHFVETDSDWLLVRKQEVRFADCYVDVAKWEAAEWGEHPQLKESLVKAGRSDLIPRNQTEGLLIETFRRLGNAARESSTQRQ